MLSIETGTDLCELLLRLAVCSAAFYTVYFLYRLWIDGGVFSNKCDVAGKVAIITGANTGIGKQTAIGLAKYGLHVVLACRDLNRAEAARRDIINITGNPNITCMQLNLSSFKSIRKFADEFSATGMNLDILINNAGVMAVGRQTTEDGLEEHIGINHFGHFLLTMLLLKRLIASTPSRIINVSSWGHRLVKFNRDDLNSEKSYNRFQAYAQSKIANIYFTKALSRRLEDTGVTCNALHPGVTYTDLSGNLSGFSFLLHKSICDILSKIFFKSTWAGAQTTIFAALDFNLQTITGVYLSNMCIGSVSTEADDDETAEWLFKKSEEICGIRFEDCVPDRKKIKKIATDTAIIFTANPNQATEWKRRT